ncbi:MAG: PEGA domain-containing protein [Planctomycetes bacterium]|nr:PEGA domain-containing protein [Planctomycetota bacterium]
MMGGGGPWPVPIDSVPQGAIVSYDGANVGVTPCTVSMNRRCSQVVLKHDGFHDQPVEAGVHANAMVLGNIVFGGVVGVVVDAASGAAMRISTEPCWVEMTPASAPRPGVWMRPAPPPSTTSDDDEGWIPEGQAIAAPAAVVARKPTRAQPWVEPPPRVPTSDEEGWVRHGTGN